MAEAGSPALPRWRRLIARRRTRVLLAIVLLLVLVRIALPAVLRRVVVSQADQALVGRIEIDDIDLSLLTGGITLHGFRVFSGEAAAGAGSSPQEAARPTSSDAASPAAHASADPSATEAARAASSPTVAAASHAAATPPGADETRPTASPAATDGMHPTPRTAPSPAPEAGTGPAGSAPVLSATRLMVDVRYAALFRRIVEVEHVELDGVAVSLDRAKDGTLLLPAAVPAPEPSPAPSPEGPGWGVLIRSVALHDGRIGFRDFAIGDPPQRVEVTLPALDASQLALLITQSGLQPGTVALDAGIQDGTLHLDAKLESLAGGPAYESHVVLANVPIADSRLYIPKVGWSGLSGRLDADLVHRFESQGAHTVRGKAALRDLDVRVAGLDDPALAWRSLALDVAGIDFVAQHADVTTVTLDGARVVTRPAGPAPLPVLQGVMTAAVEKVVAPSAAPTPAAAGAAASTTATAATSAAARSAAPSKTSTPTAIVSAAVDAPATALPPSAIPSPSTPGSGAASTSVAATAAAATPATTIASGASPPPSTSNPTALGSTASADSTPAPSVAPAHAAAAAPPSASVTSAGSKPWTWTIGTARITAGHVQAIGGDGPLGVGVEASAAPLTSTQGKAAAVHLTLVPSSGGTLDVAGDLVPAPLAFKGKLTVKDVRLAALTAPVATAATRLLKDGVANLDLAIAAGATSDTPTDGVRIAGTIGLSDIDVAGEDPNAFAVRWKSLAVALTAVTAPGVLQPTSAGAVGPIDAALGAVALTEADITLTRTADGIALPAALGGTRPAAATTLAPMTSPAPAGRGPRRAPAAPPAATARPTEAAAPPAAAVRRAEVPRAAVPTTPPASAATVPTSPQPPPVRVQIERVAIEKMRLTTHDTTVQPFFHSTLDPVDLTAAAVAWPGPSADDLKLVAKTADGGVLTLTGNVAPGRTRLVGKLTDLPLAPFNPYATSTGYGVTGGTARLDTTITITGDAYDTRSRLVLHELGVTSGEGEALFMDRFGMPLELALSLLTDLRGNIVLDLPVTGDATGMRTGIGTLLGNAVTRAILNAVTSPLKLIGAVAHIGDKPAALAPPPLAFLPGRPTLADGEVAKLAPLGGLLARAPGLRLHLRAEVGDADLRWLREQALRAKLESESGVLGSVRHIGERGARKAVLAALTARADGKPGDVPAEYQEWFEKAVAEQGIDEGAPRALADARITALRAQLASEQGIAAGRLVVDDPRLDDAAARPTVAIGLGAPPRTASPQGPANAPSAGPAHAPRAGTRSAAPAPLPTTVPPTSTERSPRRR